MFASLFGFLRNIALPITNKISKYRWQKNIRIREKSMPARLVIRETWVRVRLRANTNFFGWECRKVKMHGKC